MCVCVFEVVPLGLACKAVEVLLDVWMVRKKAIKKVSAKEHFVAKLLIYEIVC